ncbi:hypothetical protein CCP1ISM_20039 [Azospirillaceae bacterium]
MSDTQDDREITDEKILKEIESLWSEWVEHEKSTLSSLHILIQHAKSPIQNPCVYSKQEIVKYITDVHAQRKSAYNNSQNRFTELLEKTISILNKTSSK